MLHCISTLKFGPIVARMYIRFAADLNLLYIIRVGIVAGNIAGETRAGPELIHIVNPSFDGGRTLFEMYWEVMVEVSVLWSVRFVKFRIKHMCSRITCFQVILLDLNEVVDFYKGSLSYSFTILNYLLYYKKEKIYGLYIYFIKWFLF